MLFVLVLASAGGAAGGQLQKEASSGVVRRAQWLDTAPAKGDPAAIAAGYLGKHKATFGVMTGKRAVIELQTRSSRFAHHVQLQETIAGLPVHDAYIAVDVDPEGRVRQVSNDSVPGLELATAPRVVTAAQALETALRTVGVSGVLRGEITTAEIAFPIGKLAYPAWRVRIPANVPLGDWEAVVSQADGTVLALRNRLKHVDGTGRVFSPNPIVATRNTTLRDNSDSSSAVPSTAYITVPLLGLDGTGLLRGPYVDVYTQPVTSNGTPAGSVTRASSPSFQYLFDRSNGQFGEVMVYYHIDSAQRYIQDVLGFPDVNNRRISVNANAFADDNSYYSPDTRSLAFGNGGVDDAEDADVILHEYGHAIQDNQVPSFGASHEGGSMGEGFGDILASLYFSAKGQDFNVPVVADWDATSYSTANPPALRRVDGNKIWPRDRQNEVHRDGEVWSGALWAIRNRIGGASQGDRTLLRLLLQSHFSLSPQATFADGANALLVADADLNGGANIAAIRQTFVERGILSSTSAPVIAGASPRVVSARLGITVTLTGFGFTGATGVTLPGAGALSPFQVLSDTQIQAQVPAGLAAGSYIVQVTSPGGVGSGPARLHVDDHPDTHQELTLLERVSLSTPGSGNIGDGKDVDYFSFPALGGGSYTISVAAPNDLDTVVTLYGLDGVTQLAFNDDISSSNHNSRLTTTIPVSGTYFLKVGGYDARVAGPYTVSIAGPAGPDLAVNDFRGPAGLVSGQPVQLVLDTRNLGDSSVGPFNATVMLTPISAPGAAAPVRIFETTIAGLPGRGSSLLNMTTPTLSEALFPGSWRLSVMLDSGGAVQELDELNNERVLPGIALNLPRPQREITLSAPAGLSMVALEAQPFTASGALYRASDLARDLGSGFVARAIAGPDGTAIFESHIPGAATPDFVLEGSRGYIVVLPAARSFTYRGMVWPDSTEAVRLQAGANILAYPFGVPAGHGPAELLELTQGAYLADVTDTAVTDERFKTVVPGSQGKTNVTLRAGRGYLVMVPRPPASPIMLPRP